MSKSEEVRGYVKRKRVDKKKKRMLGRFSGFLSHTAGNWLERIVVVMSLLLFE